MKIGKWNDGLMCWQENVNEMMLENDEQIYQPRSRRGYEKYLYLTEPRRIRAQEFLKEYGLSDKALNERFEFRNILAEYRGQVLAKEIMFQYLRRECERGRRQVIK